MHCTFCGVSNEDLADTGDMVATHHDSGLPTCGEPGCLEQADGRVAGELAMRAPRRVRYWYGRIGECLWIAGRDWLAGMRQAHRFGHSEGESDSAERAAVVRFLTRVAR